MVFGAGDCNPEKRPEEVWEEDARLMQEAGVGSHHDIDRRFPAVEGEDPRAVFALDDRMLARVFKPGPHVRSHQAGRRLVGDPDMAH